MPADKKLGLGIQLPAVSNVGNKAHQQLRAKLHADVENFLNNGGIITVVEPGVGALNETIDKLEQVLDSNGKSKGWSSSSRHRSRIYAAYDMESYFSSRE